MRSLVIFLVLAGAAPTDPASQIDLLVERSFKPDAPGAAVLVVKDGKPILRKGYGLANVELGVAMRPEQVFQIGSITKQFTAAAIMRLADRGQLSPSDKVRKFLPEYPHPQITIEHLLTSSSGLAHDVLFPVRGHSLSPAQLVELCTEQPLKFTPGEKFYYSSCGYQLLGLIIEKLSGKSYEQFLEDEFFRPLGMSHTVYAYDQRVISGRVAGYTSDGKKLLRAKYLDMSIPFAAGALASNVDDLAAWDDAITASKVLRPSTWQRIFTPHTLNSKQPSVYGYGWYIGRQDGHAVASHTGTINGFTSDVLRLPDDHVLDIISLAMKIGLLAAGERIAEPIAKPLDPKLLEGYAGVYLLDPEEKLTLKRSGDHLTMQQTGGPVLEAFAESDRRFFVKDTLLRLGFVDGRVELEIPDGRRNRYVRQVLGNTGREP